MGKKLKIDADPPLPDDLISLKTSLHALVERHFASLRRTVRKNLVELTVAFILLTRGGRSGQGRLSLRAIARHLMTPGTAKSRYNRLDRFLKNRYFDGASATEGLVRMALGVQPVKGYLPLITDWTTIGGVQVIYVGTPFRGRVLPLCFHTLQVPIAELRIKSQNYVERIAFADVSASLPPGATPVWIDDRGFARVALMSERVSQGELFIMRGRREVTVEVKGEKKRLGDLVPPPWVPTRHEQVCYHLSKRQRVDLVTYHDPTYQEPWFLVVPPGSVDLLPTDWVVAFYRQRMTVEQGFRDWKTHQGVRGITLKVRKGERLERLLMAFAIAYALTLALGASEEAKELRDRVEILRPTPRHGTRRTLSVLSLGCGLLSDPRFAPSAFETLDRMIGQIASGRGITSLPLAPQPA